MKKQIGGKLSYGKVVYPQAEEGVTFRDIVHRCTKGNEWDELGIDLCLGSEADVPIDGRKQMFAPFNMLEAARGAVIMQGDSVRPLVLSESKVVDVEPEEAEPGFPLSPLSCVCILLVVTCIIVWLQLKWKKVIWAWDLLLFGAQGLAGCIIAFFVFLFHSSDSRLQLADCFVQSHPPYLLAGDDL